MRIRNILALFITIISVVPLVAQSDDDIPYEFGLRIAPQISFSSPDSKSLKDGGSSLDWNFGFHVAKKFNDRYAIATEVNVINMTSKLKFNETMYVESPKILGGGAYTSDMAINYNLRYLQVPILFKMRTTPIKNKWRIFGEFGMGFGFLLRSKADVNSSVLKLEDVDVDNPDNADKFKLRDDPVSGENSTKINFMRPSFIIGGGATYELFGQTKLFAGLRYDGGLYDYMDANKWNATSSFIALNLGIIF